MNEPRYGHAAVMLDDGTVLIVGGSSASAELYDQDTRTFIFLQNVPFSDGVVAVKLDDGKVLIIGDSEAPTAMIYDYTTREFQATGDLNIGRTFASLTALGHDRVLVTGGLDNKTKVSTASVEIFYSTSGIFRVNPIPLNSSRDHHGATLLEKGEVLIFGGQKSFVPGFSIELASAEVYQPVFNYAIFIGVGGMTITSSGFNGATAPRLLDGKVLVTGGSFGRSDLYDNALDFPGFLKDDHRLFSSTGDMTEFRSSHTATLLGNGLVLMTGGYIGGGPAVSKSTEYYRPSTSDYIEYWDMEVPRADHTATLLPNGRVAIIGGRGEDGAAIGQVEEFITP